MTDPRSVSSSTSRGELKTVARALTVLESFADQQSSWGVTELARELDLDKSQVHRILTTLTTRGFTSFDPLTHRYALGSRLVELGRRAEFSPALQNRMGTLVRDLSLATAESAFVCVPDGVRYRTIVARDGPGIVRYNTQIGRSYPGHLGATGHAIFAFLTSVSPSDLFTAEGEDATPGVVESLRERHERTRREGYAISDGEFDWRVVAVAAPIHTHGQIFGAVSVLGARDHLADRTEFLASCVLSTAEKISHSLSTAKSTQ